MATPLARIGDVEAVHGAALEAEERAAVGLYLPAASAMVRARFPTVDARIAAGSLNASVVAVVVATAVDRALRNPEGLKQQATGSVSLTYDRVDSTRLYLTDRDVAQLVPTRTGRAVIGTARLKAGLGWD